MKSILLFMMVSLCTMTIFAARNIKTQYPKKSESFIWSEGNKNWLPQNTYFIQYDNKGKRLSTTDYSNINNQLISKDTVIYFGDKEKEKIEYKWNKENNLFSPTTKYVNCTETSDYFCGSEVFNFDENSKSWVLNYGTKSSRTITQDSKTITMLNSMFNNTTKSYNPFSMTILVKNNNNQILNETEYNYDLNEKRFKPIWRTLVKQFKESGVDSIKEYEEFYDNSWTLKKQYIYKRIGEMNYYKILYHNDTPDSKLLGRIMVYNDDESYSDTYDTLKGESELRIKFEKRRENNQHSSVTFLYDDFNLRKITGYDEEIQKFNSYGLLTQQINLFRDTLNFTTTKYGLQYDYNIDSNQNILEIVTSNYDSIVNNFVNTDKVVFSEFDTPSSVIDNDKSNNFFFYSQQDNSLRFYNEKHSNGILKIIDLSGRTVTSMYVDSPVVDLSSLPSSSYIAYFFGETGNYSLNINITK